MPIQISDVLIFSAGGVLGYLGRQLLEHKLAIIRNLETIKTTEFNKAAAVFRAAFVNEVLRLRQSAKSGREQPDNIIDLAALVAHEKAKILFEPFVPVGKRRAFNEAWERYRCYEVDYFGGDGPCEIGTTLTNQAISGYCLKHLEHLLEFANP